jgi:hypothetical protein
MPHHATSPISGNQGIAQFTAPSPVQVAWPAPRPSLPTQLDGEAPQLPTSLWPGVDAAAEPDQVQACEWSVVDPRGELILESARRRFVAALSQGWVLLLLERESPEMPWRLRRRAHIACAPHRKAALEALAEAAALLIRQGSKDRELGLPTQALPSGFSVESDQGTKPTQGPGWRDWVGAAKVFRDRQLARFIAEYWCIGIIDAPIQRVLENERLQVRWITQPEHRGYWADPFGVPGNSDCLAAEYFDERTGLGRLETLTLDTNGEIRFREKINLQHQGHASFPTMFELDGRRLGLAETAANQRVTLHEVDQLGRWTEVADLLVGVAAADPVLFKHENLYWLAYTDIALGGMNNLCLRYAPALEGPWQEHSNNPVKVDVTSARMAGRPFVHEGQLFRPAQDCLRCYGSAVVIHRVTHLSPTRFEEVPLRRLAADPQSHLPDGFHTCLLYTSPSPRDH